MNPNFVRKRKDDTIRGPYEPSAPKIYRPSGKNSDHDSSDGPFRTNMMPLIISLTYVSVIVESLSRHHADLLQSLSHPWRVAIFSPTIWHDIKNINDMTEYLSCIQVRSPMTPRLWLILMTQNCFREKSLCHFACKCHHFAVFQSRSGKNFYQNQ